MRLIDADDLCKNSCSGGICSDCDDMFTGKNVSANCSEIRYYFLNIIERQPTVDAVEVVRCKDCKAKAETEDGEYNPEDIVCTYWMSDGLNEDDYCSYGERKEE